MTISAEIPEKIEKKSPSIEKNIVSEKTQKAYDLFIQNMTGTSKTLDTEQKIEKTTDVFNKYARDVLNGIKKDMLDNFDKIETDDLDIYTKARRSFEDDIKGLIVANTPANTSETKIKKESNDIKKLKELQDITTDINNIIQIKTLQLNSQVDTKEYDVPALKDFIQKNKIPFSGDYVNKQNENKNIFDQITEKQKEATKKEKEKKEAEENAKTATQNIDRKVNDNIDEKGAAERFFETDEATYNKLLEKTQTEEKKTPPIEPITINYTSTGTAAKLYTRVAKYTGNIPEKLGDIKIGKATNNFGKRFLDNTRVISYKKEGTEGFIVRGTEEHKQEIIANKRKAQTNKNIDRTQKYRVDEDYNITDKKPGEEKKATLKEKTINLFDDIGNFQAFKNYITNQPPENVRKNLGQIIEQINKYEPSADSASAKERNAEKLKNGYANVLTQYIIVNKTDLTMMEIYAKHLTIDNINILGRDQATRIANYNKLVPELKKLENTPAMSKETQKGIIELGIAIGATPKQTAENMISKGFDALVEQFGPMLVSVLKMFGFGKSSLLKMFGGAKDKINAMYKKEYGLSSEEMTAINNTTKYITGEIPVKDKTLRTGKELQKTFTVDAKKQYITNLTNPENCKYINVLSFQTGLDSYNKKNNSDIKISDILTITTDERTKKQSINKINKITEFTNVMNSVLENEATRSKIAAANEAIMTKTTGKVKERGANEYVQDIDTRYAITTQQDIARYLTASLFSTKDLASVMTENDLHNGKEQVAATKTVVTPEVKETVSFKAEYIDNKSIVTAAGAKKMIHDVIDMTNAPKKIQITRKDGKTEVTGILSTEGTTPTYIDEKTKKRVQIFAGDKIEAGEVQAETIAKKRSEISTNLNDTQKSAAKTAFELSDYAPKKDNLYETEIAKLSNLFTTEASYKELTGEKDTKTLTAMVDTKNISHFKNMLTYWGLKKTEKTDNIYNTMTLDPKVIANIDTTKQIFKVTEAKDGKITIDLAKNSADAANAAKEGTITINNKNGKLTTERKEKTPSST